MTSVLLLTGLVAMGKGAVAVAPAGTRTWTSVGTTAVLLLDKLTSVSPSGAGPSSVTIAIVLLPPVTGLGLNVRALGLRGTPVPDIVIVGTIETVLRVPLAKMCVIVIVRVADCDPSVVGWKWKMSVRASRNVMVMLGVLATGLLKTPGPV